MIIRPLLEDDIENVATVHAISFPRHHDPLEWIRCNFRAFPRTHYFVAESEHNILGYIQWSQRAGFRENVVLELEHIAVLPERRGQGIGRRLISDSLLEVRIHLRARGAIIKHIVVTTRADNSAQQLYKNALGAQVEFTIRDLYSADEVYMLARNFVDKDIPGK